MLSSVQICLAISAFLPRAFSYFSKSSSTLRWSALSSAIASFLAGMMIDPLDALGERQPWTPVPPQQQYGCVTRINQNRSSVRYPGNAYRPVTIKVRLHLQSRDENF